MAVDPEAIRRIIREERETGRREDEAAARTKAQDDRIAELERKLNAKPEPKKDEGDGIIDHDFES
jgi:hypothetical protein